MNYVSKKRKSILLGILFIAIIVCTPFMFGEEGCHNSEHIGPNNEIQQDSFNGTIDPTKIDASSINPEALEYYKNLAYMAKVYHSNPSMRTTEKNMRTTGDEEQNTVLSKLEDIKIYEDASKNRKVSFFDLPENKTDEFLDLWTRYEASKLAEKLDMLELSPTDPPSIIEQTNKAFREAIGNNSLANARGIAEDPFWKVKAVLVRMEKEYNQIQMDKMNQLRANQGTNSNARTNNVQACTLCNVTANAAALCNFICQLVNGYFYIPVIQNLVESVGIAFTTNSRYTLTQTEFISRIGCYMQPGRFFIHLPGGNNTSAAIVLYNNWSPDIGHTAIITKTGANALTGNPVTYSRGSNKIAGAAAGDINATGVVNEVRNLWPNQYSDSYVGQVFDADWFIFPSWIIRQWDVNSNAIYNRSAQYLGTGYPTGIDFVSHLFFGKMIVPSSFICSTYNYYVTNVSVDVNISDWYRTSIWPAGVYLSDRVRIVGSTRNSSCGGGGTAPGGGIGVPAPRGGQQ